MKLATKLLLTVLVSATLLVAPFLTYAAQPYWWPLVPCGLKTQPAGVTAMDIGQNGQQVLHDYTQPCNQCLLILLFKNLIDFMFFVVTPVLGTFFFILGGFFILAAGAGGGRPNWYAYGKKIFWNTFIGALILLSSWLITNAILKSLAGDKANSWFQIECSTGDLSSLVNATVPTTNTNPQPAPGTGTPSTNGSTETGVSCPQSGVNVCQGVLGASKCGSGVSACQQFVPLATKYASQVGGAITADLIKSVIANESTCQPGQVSSEGAYGPMQITVDAANQVRAKCGITQTIDTNFLATASNDTLVCLGSYYLQVVASGTCGSDVRNIAAGYNGGPGTCAPSVDCASDTSCSGATVQKWECLYSDTAHTQCDQTASETRAYAPEVLYCDQNPGF